MDISKRSKVKITKGRTEFRVVPKGAQQKLGRESCQ